MATPRLDPTSPHYCIIYDILSKGTHQALTVVFREAVHRWVIESVVKWELHCLVRRRLCLEWRCITIWEFINPTFSGSQYTVIKTYEEWLLPTGFQLNISNLIWQRPIPNKLNGLVTHQPVAGIMPTTARWFPLPMRFNMDYMTI